MEDRFALLTEWYDPTSALLRRYQLFYYPRDGSVEMFDVKNQRIFLRRTKYNDLHQEDLFIGNRVNVFSRQLHLIDYGDQYTANKLGSKKERTLALIKPDAVTKIGDILELIHSSNLIVTKAKMTKLTWSQADDFYTEHQGKPFFNNLVQFMSSGPVVAMELMGDEAMSIWRGLLGFSDPAVARREAPQSVRAQFGTDCIKNVGHGSDSPAAVARETEFFFPSTIGHGPSNTAVFTDCTCCIIKPHAISEGLAGKILNSISAAGFEISALQMFNMDRVNAEEFCEVYNGIVTEYPNMVTELCSGPCMALEIHGTDAPKTFREFCGPADPEIARHLRPTTLRALYGKDKVKNAVHCTDLPEDGVLEVGVTCACFALHRLKLHPCVSCTAPLILFRYDEETLSPCINKYLTFSENKTFLDSKAMSSLMIALCGPGQPQITLVLEKQEWQRNLKQNHCFAGSGPDPSCVIVQEN